MKVSINQVKINRVGINTAYVRGIRLGSASRGGQTSPFHHSLVDYWSFKGKSNFDKDRNTIKGIKGNILNAYNFSWSLGSGYGLFTENYLTYRKAENVFVTDDHSITIMNFIPANNWVIYKYGTQHLNSTRVRVTGLTANNQLAYGYSATNDGARVLMPIPKDGVYDLPENVVNISSYNVGFIVQNALTKNVTIEQIPQYEGAIVTDGIDDYLKLDKLGYKIGTVVLKYTTLFRDNTWRYVFDVQKERAYLASNKETGVFVTSMQYKFAGDYMYLIPRTSNNPTTSNTPLYIGSNSIVTESARMALYDIAIYEDILTDEEIQKEIKVMEYGTPNPVFALNFDNFAYKAVDYPDFATGKATTNKIVVDSTTNTFNGFIAAAYNPELTTGDAIELPSYKVKVTGIDAYGNLGDGYWAVALMGMPIDTSQDPWVYLFYKDGIYDIPAISLSESIYNLAVMCQIMVDKPIEIEILYDKNITKSFPETKQIFP